MKAREKYKIMGFIDRRLENGKTVQSGWYRLSSRERLNW